MLRDQAIEISKTLIQENISHHLEWGSDGLMNMWVITIDSSKFVPNLTLLGQLGFQIRNGEIYKR